LAAASPKSGQVTELHVFELRVLLKKLLGWQDWLFAASVELKNRPIAAEQAALKDAAQLGFVDEWLHHASASCASSCATQLM
jgi:hypothetical protein